MRRAGFLGECACDDGDGQDRRRRSDSEPTQASRRQLSSAESAKSKMIFGKFAMGCIMSVLKFRFPRAVNSKGAVSPLMRAKASRIPVSMPLPAARHKIVRVTVQTGVPSATPDSRREVGCKSKDVFGGPRDDRGGEKGQRDAAGEAGKVPHHVVNKDLPDEKADQRLTAPRAGRR